MSAVDKIVLTWRRTAVPRRRMAQWLAVLVSVSATSACWLTPSDHETVEDWLTVDEPDSLLEAQVVSLGSSLLKGRATTKYLAGRLAGPGDTALANLRLRFAHSYRRMNRPLTPEMEYVEGFVANAKAVYQSRAARALGEIGGTQATKRLAAALRADSTNGQDSLRSDVRDAMHRALETARTSPFGGQVSDTVGATLDTISISAAPGSSAAFDGDESVRLVGGPFPVDVTVNSAGPVVRFVLAAPIGSYSAVVENAPPGGLQRIPVLVDRVGYTPSPPATRPELWDGSRRVRSFSVLTGAVDPTTGLSVTGRPFDHFEVNPDRPVRATVDVQWRGPGWVDAMWLECPTPIPVGDFQAVVLDENSIPLSSASVRVQGSVGAPITLFIGSSGRFRVSSSQLPPLPLDFQIDSSGDSTRSIRYDAPPMHEVPIWLDGPLPPRVHSGALLSEPYRLYSDTTSTEIDNGECRVLRILKLDRDVEYLVTRVVVTYSNL